MGRDKCVSYTWGAPKTSFREVVNSKMATLYWHMRSIICSWNCMMSPLSVQSQGPVFLNEVHASINTNISCWRARVCLINIINTLRPRQNGHNVADDIFKHIFLNENCFILFQISLVPRGPISNDPTLGQIMAWHRTGYKPLCESIMASGTDAYMRHSASMSKRHDPDLATQAF